VRISDTIGHDPYAVGPGGCGGGRGCPVEQCLQLRAVGTLGLVEVAVFCVGAGVGGPITLEPPAIGQAAGVQDV
jgi:hypothetical protein